MACLHNLLSCFQTTTKQIWLKVKKQLDQLESNKTYSVNEFNLENIKENLKDYPDKTRYNWFINACTKGVSIEFLEEFPARVRDNNPQFDFNELAGIGTTILKWRKRNWGHII